MTFKIPKSHVFDDFEAAVYAHAFEMKRWRLHMSKVADDEKNNVGPIDRHVAHPMPSDHPLVEASVNENDEADYEIVDDGQTPDQVLLVKKRGLISQVSVIENDLIENVVPLGKRRINNLRENDILQKDAKIAEELSQKGFVATAAGALGLKKPADISAEVANRRSAADTQHLADQVDRRSRIEAIQRFAAVLHSDIEDLTIDTIDTWKIPSFPD
jgi:hypothetical protein